MNSDTPDRPSPGERAGPPASPDEPGTAPLFRPPWKTRPGPIPRYLVRPTLRFMRIEAAGGVAIVAAALVAMIWANAASDSYRDFWETAISFDFDILTLTESLRGWVNEALMTFFFFVIGMEIKRELVHGELRNRRQAALPIVAAAGGMILPALFYLAFNAGGPGADGWGIPVATDIAFALGVLALAGTRVPLSLKIFLLTLAVADDIGGIAIIAIFYTDDLALDWLAAALAVLALLLVMRSSGIRAIPAYFAVGAAFWLCVFESGVAATLAGVVLGLLAPATALYDHDRLTASLRTFLHRFQQSQGTADPGLRKQQSDETLRAMEHVSAEAISPLERLAESVTPWSAFLVVPIFALANAGVELGGGKLADAATSDVAWGIVAGLLAGKLVGILAFTYLAVLLGLTHLPPAVRWTQIAGIALLGGIGFTVAIFIADRSFDPATVQLLDEAKIGIFAASFVAALLGYLILRLSLAPQRLALRAARKSSPPEEPAARR